MQYSEVKYSTVQYSVVQCSTVQYSTVKYSTVQYTTVQYSTVQCSKLQYSTVQSRPWLWWSGVSIVSLHTDQLAVLLIAVVQAVLLEVAPQPRVHTEAVITAEVARLLCEEVEQHRPEPGARLVLANHGVV